MDSFFYLIILAGIVAGASTGFLGVYIVGMRMPFIGTCISHAAMAGTVLSYLVGVSPSVGAVLVSAVCAGSLATLEPDRSRLDTNVALGIVFSLMLGLTFLGIGLVDQSRSEILGLLWGNILFINRNSFVTVVVTAVVLAMFAWLFNKEMKAILFSRSIASATGIHERFVYAMFLLLCGITLSVNLRLVGGLMIFSLITNPAAAAYQLCRGHRLVVLVSTLFGVLSTAIGFLVSFYFDLPTGACIVIASTAIFGMAVAVHRVRARMD
jgi:manganese/iron transport system permease protein